MFSSARKSVYGKTESFGGVRARMWCSVRVFWNIRVKAVKCTIKRLGGVREREFGAVWEFLNACHCYWIVSFVILADQAPLHRPYIIFSQFLTSIGIGLPNINFTTSEMSEWKFGLSNYVIVNDVQLKYLCNSQQCSAYVRHMLVPQLSKCLTFEAAGWD